METKYKMLHYELWNWLVENPGEFKQHWPGWLELPFHDDIIRESFRNYCFLCAWFPCGVCPLTQKGISTVFGTCKYYDVWQRYTFALMVPYGPHHKRYLKSRVRKAAIQIRDAWK